MEDSFQLTEDYSSLLIDLRERISGAQVRAALAVNRELVVLYWQSGNAILARQRQHGWGAKVIDRLSADLRQSFPDIKGFSPRNLKYMRALAEAYQDEEFMQQSVAQIPWGYNMRILETVEQPAEREWYIRQTIKHGWSRHYIL